MSKVKKPRITKKKPVKKVEKKKLTEEELKKKLIDLNLEPPSSEKYFKSLLLCSNSENITNMESLFTGFKMELEKENFLEILSSESFKKLNELIKDANLEKIQNVIIIIKPMIKPFDIPIFLNLMEKSSNAKKKIKGKDLILLVGDTGVGKSTSVLFFGGSEFEKKDGKLVVKKFFSKESKEIEPGDSGDSCTSFINSVEFSPYQLGVICDRNLKILLTDTPGFRDTRGPEIDASNSYGMIRALREAKSMRVAIVLSSDFVGALFQKIEDILDTVIGIFPQIEECLESFSLIFTKYENCLSVKRIILEKLKAFAKRPTIQEKNSTFKKLLENLISRMDSKTTVKEEENEEEEEENEFDDGCEKQSENEKENDEDNVQEETVVEDYDILIVDIFDKESRKKILNSLLSSPKIEKAYIKKLKLAASTSTESLMTKQIEIHTNYIIHAYKTLNKK